MQARNGRLFLSATDLAAHLSCKHLTQLNRDVAEGRREAPRWSDPAQALLQQRGLEHETAYLESLRREGPSVVTLGTNGHDATPEMTLAAMQSGAQVIVQAPLLDGRWQGRADVLLRVERPSALGTWSYEVVDTKLARETKAGTILQLSLYTDMVGVLQGLAPECMYVVTPASGLTREVYRYQDFQAYYRLVRSQLESAVDATPQPSHYPAPVAHCEICRWWRDCDTQRRADDHLCLVAGIRSLQIQEINRQGAMTLTQFAEQSNPLRERPERGAPEAYASVHAQAGIQLRGRRAATLLYELLAPEPARGLQLLPAPSAGDVFLDLEADPFVDDGGLEYLFGLSFVDTDGSHSYEARWAISREDEKRAFEQLIDALMNRWQADAGMHVYHFSPYEPAALKRLMSRHATREREMDRLLRGGRFIDLHAVVRQGLRASVESYSLKQLEPLFGIRRSTDLRDASAALRRVQCALEFRGAAELEPADRATVEGYNREDCLSAAALHDWLECRRQELEAQGNTLARPPDVSGEASDAVEQRAAHVQAVFDSLIAGLPADRTTWSPAQRARWLLAHLLDYFRREDRCAWWEFFRLHELENDDLLDERKAVAGLEFERAVGGTAKCPIHRYRFPPQEVSLDGGEELHEVRGDKIGTVADIDTVSGRLDIKKRAAAVGVHPHAVVVNEHVAPEPLDSSLLALALEISQINPDPAGPHSAAWDLLCKAPPRLRGRPQQTGSLRRAEEAAVNAATRLVQELDRSVLSIQGPPGSGKTHTGAQMIVELLRRGQRVGVTAVSHKVIRNLLDKVLAAARDAGVHVEAVHKVSAKSDGVVAEIEETTDNEEALAALRAGKLLGGTGWLWARDDAVASADYLFVDEAGQMSLAHVLAASRAARNLVLLGDPQQLQQPQRGAHPEGAEISALEHILDGYKTMPTERGLFLDQTWRLHPNVCRFTSELYYDERLQPRPENVHQTLGGNTPFAGAGLFHVPVEHEGNQNSSAQEVDVVASLVAHLLQPDIRWTDVRGAARALTQSDILIVAPYNSQVAAISQRLPDVRVGTVDKFQGQEAAVVMFSLASSSADDAPRGLSFLYDPHRLNVATSRARCAAIVVASPRLFEPDCRTPEQMRWANGLCRFRELATVVNMHNA